MSRRAELSANLTVEEPVDLRQDPLLGIQLAQDGIGAQFLGGLQEIDVVERTAGRDRDDPDLAIETAQQPDDFVAIHAWHEDVRDDYRRVALAVKPDPFLAGRGFNDLMAGLFQDAPDVGKIDSIV